MESGIRAWVVEIAQGGTRTTRSSFPLLRQVTSTPLGVRRASSPKYNESLGLDFVKRPPATFRTTAPALFDHQSLRRTQEAEQVDEKNRVTSVVLSLSEEGW